MRRGGSTYGFQMDWFGGDRTDQAFAIIIVLVLLIGVVVYLGRSR